MTGQPIEPAQVELSGERTDGAATAPPTAAPGPIPPPPRRSTPPPAGPPATPPPPPPSSPSGGAWGLPEPREPWRGGGVATAPAPVYVAAPPVTYVTNNHYYPVARTAVDRFNLGRLRPVWNGTAAAAALFLVPVTGHLLDADKFGFVYAAAAVAAVGELGARMKRQHSSWLMRLLSWHVVEIGFLTPAGLHALAYMVTGA